MTVEELPAAVDACESSVQQRWIWCGPRGAGARTTLAVGLPGEPDPAILRARFAEAVAANEILRTSLVGVAGLRFPGQVVHPDGEPGWRTVTVDGSATARLRELWDDPWQSGPGPVLRVTLARSGSGPSVLIVSVPVSCGDLTSLRLLVRAALSGAEPPEAVQYADFAGWQLEQFGSVPDGEPVTEPPTRLPLHAPGERGSGLAVRDLAVGGGRIEEWARDQDTSAERFLLGCCAVLIARLTRRTEVTLDLVSSGRSFADLGGACGPFEVAVPVTCAVEPEIRLPALVARLEALAGDPEAALIGQHRALLTGGSPAGELALRVLTGGQADPEVLAASDGGATHRLTLTCVETAAGYRIALTYDVATVSATAAEGFLAQFCTLVEDAAGEPDRLPDAFRLVDAGERDRIRSFTGQDGPAVTVPDATVHGRFEAQAALTPDRVAVEYGDERLTFAEVDRRADALAGVLLERGAGAGRPVLVHLDRSVELVVGVLAVLKAGSPYLPVDLDAPAARVRALVERSGVAVVLTRRALRDRLPSTLPAVVWADEAPPDAAAAPRGSGSPDDLAYVIHTSGSTGLPKAVAVSHRSVLHLYEALRATVYDDLPAALRVAVNGPLAFDTSVKQLIQLLGGHTVLPVPAELRFEPEQLVDFLDERRIDVVDCTPAQLALWLDAGLLGRLRTPRALLIGGEPIGAALWDRLLAARTLVAVNLYGPTECTVDVTACHLRPSSPTPRLGRALPHARVRLFDERGRLVPLGSPGEICVSGPALARGYLGDEEATRAAFVPDPEGEPGDRMYRTGDLGRYLETGELEYLGRIDRQLKIRGVRVEPGEVEAALCRHPSIRSAVVTGVPGRSGTRLAGYCVPVRGGAFDAADVLRFLGGELPTGLIPSTLTKLSHLPLTRNGKVDLAALPDPGSDLRPPYVAPSTERERVLAEVWSEVLGIDGIGRDDNFFGVGGDSIQSIQVTALARRRGVAITPGLLFRHQTVTALAAAVAERETAPAEPAVVTGDVALTPIQHRFFDRRLAEPGHWNQSILLEVPPEVTPGRLRAALSSLIAHHDALRLRFTVDGGRRQHVAPDEPADPLVEHDCAGLTDAEFDEHTERLGTDVQRGLDITRGPVVKALHLRRGELPARLLIVIHHLAVDGVSWGILLEDLEAALRELPLPAKTTSFPAWAAALSSYARGDEPSGEIGYWTRQLPAEDHRLPRDHPEGGTSVAGAVELVRTLDRRETSALREYASASRARVADVVLAAVGHALSRWSGTRELVFDCEGHGREEHVVAPVDLTRTVGWFTTVFPARIELPPWPFTLADAVARVSGHMRAIPNRGLGFGVLRHLREDDPLPGRPGPDLIFNYLGQVDRALGVEEPLCRPIDGPAGPDRSPRAERGYAFEIDCAIVEDELRVHWTFGTESHRHETVARLADDVVSVLRRALAGISAPEPGTEACPPSPQQRGMLTRHRTAPRFGQHLYQWILDLREELDLERWQKAWDATTARHDALRASFPAPEAADPVVVFAEAASLDTAVLDWSGLTRAEQARRQTEYLTGIQAAGIDLAEAPLIDCALAKLGPGQDRLLFTFSLLALDAPSFGTALDEVWQRYAAPDGEVPAAITGPGVSYRGYAAGFPAAQDDPARRFWRGAWKAAGPPASVLPPRAADRTAPRRYTELVQWFDDTTTEALLAFGRRHGVTPGAILQMLWADCLSVHIGVSEVAFCAIVSARPPGRDWEDAVGRFVNFLPVLARAEPERPLADRVRDHQEWFFDALAHPYVPAEWVADWSGAGPSGRLLETLVAWEVEPFAELLAQPHWAVVADLDVVQDPDVPVKLTGTLSGRLRASLAYLADEVPDALAEELFARVRRGVELLAGPN